jgi:serine/threonine protein kinase
MMNDPSHPPTFAAPDPQALSALFPGYEIETLIATGGMGAVYRAVQRSLDRVVAIKILPREFGADPAFRESFEAEAKAMAKLNHPNLIGVFDFGEVDGMLFIIMEFVSGGSLYHFAYGKALDGVTAGQLVEAVCDGLAHAHEHGILHRDIKPANILLDAQGRPKIGDFGLARVIGKQVEAGETVYGTPHYTAPEVINHPASVDSRADIFSIGVMLHELLTTKLPANDKRPSSAISGCDSRFDAIVKRATNPRPDLRYPSAAAMGKDLKAVVEALSSSKQRSATAPAANRPGARGPVTTSYPVAAAPVSNRPAPRIPTPVATQSRKSGGGGMMVVVVLILAGAAAAYFLTKKPPQPPPAGPALDAVPSTSLSPSTSQSKPPERLPDKPTTRQEPKPQTQPGFPRPTTPEVTQQPKPADPAFVERPEIKPDKPASNFDLEGFLKRARDITLAKAQPNVLKHQEGLAKNVDAFGRGLKRISRRLGYGEEAADYKIEKLLETIRGKGNRIPEEFDFKEINDKVGDQVRDVFAEHLATQAKLDSQLSTELLELSRSTYILGIELQIKRLKAQNDETAAESLAAEITATQADATHFETLMLGGPVVPPVEEPKKDEKKDEKKLPPL